MLDDAALGRVLAGAEDAVAGRYVILEEVGRGAMGSVHRALDTSLGREVAVKIAHQAGGPELEHALLQEAHVLARLEHPGIVPVLGVGVTHDGRAYVAMRLVRGDGLDKRLLRPLLLAEGLRIVLRICEAVAYAHALGVVHRDLKPSNIMLGEFGEAVVLDWGLAPLASRAAGTPGYAAPEVEAGGGGDARSDVFALGMLLKDVLRAADQSPRGLRRIADQATATHPADRYDSAGPLAADIRAFQDGRKIAARGESVIERAQRLARPHQVAIALVAAYVAMRIIVILATGY